MSRPRQAPPRSQQRVFVFEDDSDDDDVPVDFFMFMATLTHLRRRLQAHPLSFLLHHELIRRLSATPRLAFDVERQGPLFVLANLRTSFPDAVLERICGRDMLEAFGLVEPSRPNSPLRAHPPARSDSPPSACIVELEELQAADSTKSATGSNPATPSEPLAAPSAEGVASPSESDLDAHAESDETEPTGASKRAQPRRTRSKLLYQALQQVRAELGAASGHAAPVPASRLGQRLIALDRQYLEKAGVYRLKDYIMLAAEEGCRIRWLHGERVGTL